MSRLLVGMSEYARLRGVARSTITRAVARGDITLVNEKVDVDIADLQWFKAYQASSRLYEASGLPNPVATPGPTSERGGATLQALRTDQARIAKHEADMAEMRSRQMAGQLIELAPTMRAITECAALTRSFFERIPDKLAERLAAELTPAACHRLLTDAIVEVLEDLAKSIRLLQGQIDPNDESRSGTAGGSAT